MLFVHMIVDVPYNCIQWISELTIQLGLADTAINKFMLFWTIVSGAWLFSVIVIYQAMPNKTSRRHPLFALVFFVAFICLFVPSIVNMAQRCIYTAQLQIMTLLFTFAVIDHMSLKKIKKKKKTNVACHV